MNIQLDFRSGQPIYVQIVEQIRRLVSSGELKPGDQLPTVRQLATELRVNFNTVARAYRMLDESGVISTQQGRGTYITEKPPPELVERLRHEALAGLARRFIGDALRLGFTESEMLASLQAQIQRHEAGIEEGE